MSQLAAPRCECHGIPMLWFADARNKKGGRWNCRETNRARCRQYRQTYPEKLRASNRERNPRRVRIGELYVGIAKSAPEAKAVTAQLAEKLAAFKAEQAIEHQEMREHGWIDQAVA